MLRKTKTAAKATENHTGKNVVREIVSTQTHHSVV